MKKTTQMRINNEALCIMYEVLLEKVSSFVDHVREDGSPVFIHTEKNEIILALFYKVGREVCARGLFDKTI